MDFPIQEIEEIIAESKDSSLPGNNMINYHTLKLLLKIVIQTLLHIFKKIILESSFPVMWKKYDLILLNLKTQISDL